MGPGADVRSVEAIETFRQSLITIHEDAREALVAASMEIRRMMQWLDQDHRLHWEQQLKRRREEVSQAKADLARKRLQGSQDSKPSVVEEKDRLRAAERRFEEAEMKLKLLKKWSRQVQQAAMLFEGHARNLQTLLDGDPPASIGELDRSLAAIERYRSAGMPISGTPAVPPTTSGGSGQSGSGSE